MDRKYSKRDEPRYVEQSLLINLFTEDKFWGWALHLSNFSVLVAVFCFQFQVEEQEENNGLTPK